MPSSTRKYHRGFTLIELLLVLAIMSLLMLPMLSFQPHKLSFDSQFEQFRHNLSLAQSRAIHTRQPVMIELQGRYYKIGDQRIALSGDAALHCPLSLIEFSPKGQLLNNSGQAITEKLSIEMTTTKRKRQLHIQPQTGFISQGDV